MVEKIEVESYLKENTYIYIDEETNHGFLIDPGFEADKIISVIKENGWIIEKILITHGHFDHISAVNEISKEFNIPVYASKKSKAYLENPNYNMSFIIGDEVVVKDAHELENGEKIFLEANNDIYFKVVETPGHTFDSVIYINEKENFAFVGDTIFKGTHGRTDLLGSNEEDMKKSLELILSLDENMILYPGHSEETTVKNERMGKRGLREVNKVDINCENVV